jgi:L-ribulose-5-phosphate 4-epimerase
VLTELKREAYEANLALPRHGLIHFTFGNASALDRDRGILAIKPSGVPFEKLRPVDMVLIDLSGKIVESKLAPSSDTPTHRRLYLEFKQIGGIVHTHSCHATAFAQAGRAIPNLGTTHADYFAGEIPITRKLTRAEISGHAYEWETGNAIVERFQKNSLAPLDVPGVIVNRHAPFTWHTSVAQAVEIAVAVEYLAHMAFLSLQLEPRLKPIESALSAKHFTRKHGPKAYYGQASRR